MACSKIDIFILQKGFFPIQNITKHYFYAYFAQKGRMKILKFLSRIMD